MTRKKKLGISKMLAVMIYTAENEPNISPESFDKLVSNCFDIAFEVGSFSLMSTTMKLVKALRNTRTQKDMTKIEHSSLCETETFKGGD